MDSASAMSLPAPFAAAGDHILIELGEARAVFTTRRGGFSAGPYATLNLGRWTEDDPTAVERNHQSLSGQLGVELHSTRQVHGSRVERVRELGDRLGRATDPPSADGQATNARGAGLLVLTADCLPVAVGGAGAVAILHCGWRGLAAGVLDEGVRALRELGRDGPLSAAIGPGAGVCCYETGPEVHERFSELGPGVRRGTHLDLKAIARAQLGRAGVEHVHDCDLCTMCADPSWFFSHRRNGGITGRQGGVAWLT